MKQRPANCCGNGIDTNMLTPLKSEILSVGDLSHEARRFRTILWSFERNMELLFKDTGLKAEVDQVALAEAFSRWRQAFDHSKYLASRDRRDFVIYAAGLMLKELIVSGPLKAVQGDVAELPAQMDHRLKRWPEGYAYTSFCLSVAAAILKEMGDEEPASGANIDEPGFWDSFRENTLESPAMAVAFFDLVCGQEPNWDAPDVPWLRRIVERHDRITAGMTP
jgi:hypothetical protein